MNERMVVVLTGAGTGIGSALMRKLMNEPLLILRAINGAEGMRKAVRRLHVESLNRSGGVGATKD
jgi:NADP-dependent 3-hydroxy acid dehydrogenase YdfG